jgi:hypothetical protein
MPGYPLPATTARILKPHSRFSSVSESSIKASIGPDRTQLVSASLSVRLTTTNKAKLQTS